MVIEQGKDTERLFSIERFAAGYFAVRDGSPAFALCAPTAVEATEIAMRALDKYEDGRELAND